MKMGKCWLPFAVIGLCAGLCAAEVVTYRDAQGRIVRTVTTDRNGQTSFRDGQGRLLGTVVCDGKGKRTSTTDRNGRTTHRDGQGRLIGTETIHWRR